MESAPSPWGKAQTSVTRASSVGLFFTVDFFRFRSILVAPRGFKGEAAFLRIGMVVTNKLLGFW